MNDFHTRNEISPVVRRLVARYSGEEFLVVLPATDEGAIGIAERMRQAIAEADGTHRHKNC